MCDKVRMHQLVCGRCNRWWSYPITPETLIPGVRCVCFLCREPTRHRARCCILCGSMVIADYSYGQQQQLCPVCHFNEHHNEFNEDDRADFFYEYVEELLRRVDEEELPPLPVTDPKRCYCNKCAGRAAPATRVRA